MQRKKLKLTSVFFTALMLLLYTPSVVSATDNTGGETNQKSETRADTDSSSSNYDLGTITGQVTISDSSCPKKCLGHTITNSGASPSNKTIQITTDPNVKKKHTIYIDGTVNIDAGSDAPAFQVCNGADVELVLNANSNSTFKSSAGAGLQVDRGAKLTIRGKGELKAIGGASCAGIGGASRNGCGDITILDGTIRAEGGTSGAGIGTGREGTCGNISIQGGTITALGGPGKEYADVGDSGEYITGGPGIGHGDASYGGNGGNITVSGGKIIAIGGENDGATQTSGFSCDMLLSNKGSADITTNSLSGVRTIPSDLNAIIWEAETLAEAQHPKKGTVYGAATLDRSLVDVDLIMRPNSSLTIPKNPPVVNIDEDSTITGNATNSIIIAGNLNDQGYISPTINKKVSLARGDILVHNNQVYTGKNLKAEIFELIDPRPDPSDPDNARKALPVDTTNWNWENPKVELGGVDQEGVICNANPIASYKVIFEHTTKGVVDDKFEINDIKVLQRDLKECDIEPITGIFYDGTPKEPKPNITYGDKELDPQDGDYTIKYKDNVGPGEATAIITVDNQNGNFTLIGKDGKPGSIELKFTIAEISIENADVQIDPTPLTYNAKKQEKEPTVTLDGKTLTPGTDYEVTYSPVDCTDAGTVTMTITGKGHYGGNARTTPSYTINPKPLTIAKLTAVDRKYEKGITTVDVIAEYGKDELAGDDKPEDIVLESKGTITSDEVGEYASVTFAEDPLTLGGNKGGNYILNNPGGDVILTPAVKITQADAPATPDLDTTMYTLDSAHADRFVYTAAVTNPDERVTYEYRLNDTDLPDDQGWQDSPVFDNIEPTSTHTFEVRSKADKNIKQSKTGVKDITFTKLKNPDKPGAITLTPTPNRDNETFTETISSETKWENVEFFIGEKGEEPVYSDSNDAYVKKDCEANTEYIGYVRYKETATHQASDPVTATNRTDMRPVSKPVISPGDGTTFVEDTLEVTIKCKTKGADIYYTIDDGSENSTDEPIKYDGPFLIGEELPGETTITINAYATKNNMTDSEPADEVKITKKLPYIETPVISLKDSEETEFDHKGQEVTISCETEDVDIYYTLDGTDPTRESEKYSSRKAIKIDDTTTVKAFAVKEDKTMNDSPIATADFTRIWLTVATPEIHPEEDVEVAGSKQVRLECNTEDATIYYTTDGNDPTPENSTKYKGKPFRVNAPATVKAYAVKDDMLDSAIASVVINQSDSMIEVHSKLDPFIQDDEDERHPLLTPELKEKLLERKEIERIEGDELAVAEYLMTRELDVKGYAGDFVPTNMKFYNLKMWIKIGEKIIDKPVIDDFPAEGYTITVPYPTEVAAMAGARPEAKWEDYNYAIAHMVSEGENVGEDIDTWYGEQITKTPYGLQISITSASPFAIAWTTSQNEEVNNKLGDGIPAAPEDPGTEPQDPSTDNPDDSQPMVTPNPSTDSPGGDGAPSGGGSTGAGAVADAIKSALSSVLPKTGDTNKIIAWVVVLAASIAVIVGLRIRSKKGKGKTKEH
ncbi:MAG: chitobiase/beta-hexosaminidase C-terminal domain-containing protein [Lachnospiraceae bacterium]